MAFGRLCGSLFDMAWVAWSRPRPRPEPEEDLPYADSGDAKSANARA